MRISPKRAIARVTSVLITVLITAPLLTTSAQADPDQSFMERICPVESYPEIEVVGEGAESIISLPYVFDGTEDPDSENNLPLDATVYGQYGTKGLNWHSIQKHCLDGFTDYVPRVLGDTMFDWAKSIGHTSIVIYSYSLNDQLLSRVGIIFSGIITGLRDNLWRPLIPTVVILGAAWMAWAGLVRKRFTLSVEGAIWMVASTAFFFWLLASPVHVINMANTLVSAGSALVNNSVTSSIHEGIRPSRDCPIGIYKHSESLAEDRGRIPEKAEWETYNNYYIRVNSELLYRNLLCEPWIRGQYGDSVLAEGAAIDNSADVFQSQSVSQLELRKWHDEAAGEHWEGTNHYVDEVKPKKNEQYEQARSDVETYYPAIYPMFAGDHSGERASVAFMTLAGNILVASVVIVLSIALMVAKFAFLVALVISPFIGILGIHPGWGRGIFFRWVEITLGLLLKQIFFTFLVSLYVGVSGAVMSAGDIGGGIIIMIVFLLTLLVYRRQFSSFFNVATDGHLAMDRITSTASNIAPEIKKASNALPFVAYGRAQKWGWNNKYKIAAASAGVGSFAAAHRAQAGPDDAPPLRGLRRRAAEYLERTTAAPGSAAETDAAPRRSASSPATVAPSIQPKHAPPLPPPSSTPRKGWLGAGEKTSPNASSPTPGAGPPTSTTRPTRAPAPLPLNAPATSSTGHAPTSGRRPEDAPNRPIPRPNLGTQWSAPSKLKNAVPWHVPRRKIGIPKKLFPFGDNNKK